MLYLLRFLTWIGLTYQKPDGRWFVPISFAPRHAFKDWKSFRAHCLFWGTGRNTVLGFYRFRNLPHVVKWKIGRLLPNRWGFGFFGLIEIGDRGGSPGQQRMPKRRRAHV